ncbi:MAG: hypothetical protein FWH32_04875 [Clostridiales bacterium]|nr:hypothetical protein [Clostridiales bacterium]
MKNFRGSRTRRAFLALALVFVLTLGVMPGAATSMPSGGMADAMNPLAMTDGGEGGDESQKDTPPPRTDVPGGEGVTSDPTTTEGEGDEPEGEGDKPEGDSDEPGGGGEGGGTSVEGDGDEPDPTLSAMTDGEDDPNTDTDPPLQALNDPPDLLITTNPITIAAYPSYAMTWDDAADDGTIRLSGGETMVIADDAGSPDEPTVIAVTDVTNGDTVTIESQMTDTIENLRINVREPDMALSIKNLKLQSPKMLTYNTWFAAIDFITLYTPADPTLPSTPNATIGGTIEFAGINYIEGLGSAAPGIRARTLTLKSTDGNGNHDKDARLTAKGTDSNTVESNYYQMGRGILIYYGSIAPSNPSSVQNALVVEADTHVTGIGGNCDDSGNRNNNAGLYVYGQMKVEGTLIGRGGDSEGSLGGNGLYVYCTIPSNGSLTADELASEIGVDAHVEGIGGTSTDPSYSSAGGGGGFAYGDNVNFNYPPLVVKGTLIGTSGKTISATSHTRENGLGVEVLHLVTEDGAVITGTGGRDGIRAMIPPDQPLVGTLTGIGEKVGTLTSAVGQSVGIHLSPTRQTGGDPTDMRTFVIGKNAVLTGISSYISGASSANAAVYLSLDPRGDYSGFSTMVINGIIKVDEELLARYPNSAACVELWPWKAGNNFEIGEDADVTAIRRRGGGSTMSEVKSAGLKMTNNGATLTINGKLTAYGSATADSNAIQGAVVAPGVGVLGGNLHIGATAEIIAVGGTTSNVQGLPIKVEKNDVFPEVTVESGASIKNGFGEDIYMLQLDRKPDRKNATTGEEYITQSPDIVLGNELRLYTNVLSQNSSGRSYVFVPTGWYNAALKSPTDLQGHYAATSKEVVADHNNVYQFKAGNPTWADSTMGDADLAVAPQSITLRDDSGNVLDSNNRLNLAVGETNRIVPTVLPTNASHILVWNADLFNAYNTDTKFDQGFVTGLAETSGRWVNFSSRYGSSTTSITASTSVVVDGTIAAKITIDTQPAATMTVVEGDITSADRLTVAASVDPSTVVPTYQWYSNTTNSSAGGTAIGGATAANFAIPTDLAVGTYYYFCEVRALGATPVRSDVAVVTVKGPPPFVSAVVDDDVLTITFGAALDSTSVPDVAAFSVGGITSDGDVVVLEVELDGATVTLTLSEAAGDTDFRVTVSYDADKAGLNKLKAPTADGDYEVKSFTDKHVTNLGAMEMPYSFDFTAGAERLVIEKSLRYAVMSNDLVASLAPRSFTNVTMAANAAARRVNINTQLNRASADTLYVYIGEDVAGVNFPTSTGSVFQNEIRELVESGMVRVIPLSRPATVAELRGSYRYDYAASEIVLDGWFETAHGLGLDLQTANNSNFATNGSNTSTTHKGGLTRLESAAGARVFARTLGNVEAANRAINPIFASPTVELATVNATPNQKWNTAHKVGSFVDFASGAGEFGGTKPLWRVPDRSLNYEWSTDNFANPLNTKAIVEGMFVPTELFNPDSTANNAQFRIRRAAIDSTIGAGAASGQFRIPKVRNRTAYPKVNANTMTFSARTSQEYLVVKLDGTLPTGTDATTLQGQIQSGIIDGTLGTATLSGGIEASILNGGKWTRVTRTAMPIREDWAGAYVYLREAATLTQPYSLMSSPLTGSGNNARFRDGLTKPIDITRGGPDGSDDIEALLGGSGGLFVYNVNTGALTVNRNVPDEFRIMGYTAKSRINVSTNGMFFVQATNKLDLRPYMTFEDDEYYIYAQLQGNVKGTRTSVAVRLSIDLATGAVAYAPLD